MANPLRWHRSSLEGIMIPAMQSLKLEEHDRATSIFNDIVVRFEPSQTAEYGYKPITLIALMEKEVSEKDEFLRFFFSLIGQNLSAEGGERGTDVEHVLSRLASCDSWTIEEKNALGESLAAFAKYLVDNFFLPLKALGANTPQPTPAPNSPSILSDAAIGTPQRLSNLRRNCLVRDRHRCVITRKFDSEEAEQRYERDDDNAKDDDGKALGSEDETFATLEVAHIIPHSLLSLTDEEGGRKLGESKQIAYMILKMFNPTAVELINGQDIDRPVNALSMTMELHRLFGNFKIAFEQIGHPGSHMYTVDYVKPGHRVRTENLPVTVSLPLTPERNIDPPSPELLAIHRAIGRILHLSAAGEYIDRFLRDMEELEGSGLMENG